MRAARLVGLSQDGQSLIVTTDTGTELALAVDDRLRAAMRGDRPRLGQLEIEMDTALSPREIQTRIRSGDSLEDVARVANLPLDRVERFAAPVLAEREHVASLALSSSVRRRGETSGHRNLRTVLTERLTGRGVDPDTLQVDAYRLADGRWGVTADYRSGESERTAEFIFDLQGRYSVAANDDARWVLSEQSPSRGPQPGRRPPTPGQSDPDGTEPTIDLSDELAIVRAVQEPAPEPASVSDGSADRDEDQDSLAVVRTLHPLPDGAEEGEPVELDAAEADVPAHGSTLTSAQDGGADGSEPQVEVEITEIAVTEVEVEVVEGGMDVLAEIFADHNPEPAPPHEGGHDAAAETDAGRPSDPGVLSDAVAVPATSAEVDGAWEPAIVVDYPVEPGSEDELPFAAPPALADRFDEQDELSEDIDEVEAEGGPVTDARSEPETLDDLEAVVETEARPQSEPAVEPEPASPITEPEQLELIEAPASAEPAPKPTRRKRASVPSWDEIMFGGPKQG